MTQEKRTRRVIQVSEHIIGPIPPKPNRVVPKKTSDFPGVPGVHLEVAAKLSNPLLMGPPLCDEFVALVQHLLTEEEAGVVRHLGSFRGKSAEAVARAEHRPLEEVKPVLDRLADEKHCIVASGPDDKRSYKLMPLFPGIFEMVLIGEAVETLSPWHRRFAELFDALFETGYILEYGKSSPFVRYFPARSTIQAHPMALPSDKLESILEPYDAFGVGNCQCRITAEVMGEGCGKPIENCCLMGEMAERGVSEGWLKRVTKQEMIEIKAEAESHGLVSWMINVEGAKSQSSCSCCGCCCRGMRTVNEFNAPSMIAPPHFIPRLDAAKCTYCGKCARSCPMGALTLDVNAKTWVRDPHRCIGCGLCVVACPTQGALVMEPAKKPRLPYRSTASMMASSMPLKLLNAFTVWLKRR